MMNEPVTYTDELGEFFVVGEDGALLYGCSHIADDIWLAATCFLFSVGF